MLWVWRGKLRRWKSFGKRCRKVVANVMSCMSRKSKERTVETPDVEGCDSVCWVHAKQGVGNTTTAQVQPLISTADGDRRRKNSKGDAFRSNNNWYQ
jgi:hypothetical protein